MCFARYSYYYFVFLCLLALECYTLNCRTDGGPKESELKKIYTKCLKIQEDKTSNSSRSNSQAWNKPQRNNHNQRRDQERDRSGNDDRRRNRNDEINNNDGRMGYNENRMSSNDRMRGNDGMSGNERMSGKMGDRYDMMGERPERGSGDHFNARNDFMGDKFGEMSAYGSYQSSTTPPRRYKRERRIENSGHRSQFNPISQKSDDDDSFNDEKDSNENKTNDEMGSKECAMHCFLENLKMNGEDGMPDRYLVNHALTKEVKNEDLRDFLQESVEECFQILDNENTDDKCDFSRNLLMCLSEKGRANCDDWKDDLQL
ncbi:general odorant-binding protein 71 isoform X2 [Bombyx mori]|uniref:Uncharacterized protein n=1 Tax=Bombyx mori TaxID=7091 RepID=A0A8R2LVT8_BOMMO|nr:general odorant-binding protein 71 [Bombyx mori]